MSNLIMEFRCGNHCVGMCQKDNGAYAIMVTHSGVPVAAGVKLGNETYEVAEVIDKGLAVHCFNHTAQQYQRETLG